MSQRYAVIDLDKLMDLGKEDTPDRGICMNAILDLSKRGMIHWQNDLPKENPWLDVASKQSQSGGAS